jgi:spectinomycin phosphotransferase
VGDGARARRVRSLRERSVADRSGVLDARLFEWLEADFDLRAVEAFLVEGGVDRQATLWRVRDVIGRDLAVKWSSGGTVAGLTVSHALAHAGVDGVVAPLSANDGRLWSDRGGRRLVVLPWVDAPVALDAVLEERHWVALGRLLAVVHALPVAGSTDLPSSDQPHRRLRRDVAAFHRALDEALDLASTTDTGDDLTLLLLDEAPMIRMVVDALLSGADHLHATGIWSRHGTPNVVCHADPHLGNVLVGDEGGVWLLDWDDVVLGPREQDLLFVLDGGVLAVAPVTAAQTEAFFTGYGPVELDRHALAYHRSLRALEDLVDFTLEVLAPDRHARPTREAAYRYLRGNLASGSLTEAALRSLHEIGLLASIPALRCNRT